MSFSPPNFFRENVKKGIDTYLLRDTIGSTGTQYIELGQHKRVGGQGEPSAVRVIGKPESSENMEGIEMTISFTDREYKIEHGKAPKGFGFWGFTFEGYEFWASGTLTEAKKACRNHIKELAPENYKGFVSVNILP